MLLCIGRMSYESGTEAHQMAGLVSYVSFDINRIHGKSSIHTVVAWRKEKHRINCSLIGYIDKGDCSLI